MEGFFMRVIKMNVHGKHEITDIPKGIEALEEIIGGEIEGVTFAGRTDMILFLDEMAKADDEPVNCLATMVILNYSNVFEIVNGDAVICGLDEDGDTCSLSDEQIDELLYVFAGNCTPEVVSSFL